jgi:hypothetical protein
LQAELQQTPSAQNPLEHSVPQAQVAPSAFEAVGHEEVSGETSGTITSTRSTASRASEASATDASPPSGLLAGLDLWQPAPAATATTRTPKEETARNPGSAHCRTHRTRVMTFDKSKLLEKIHGITSGGQDATGASVYAGFWPRDVIRWRLSGRTA